MVIISEWVVNVSLLVFDPYLLEGFGGLFAFYSMHEIEFSLSLKGLIGENFELAVKREGCLSVFGVRNRSYCLIL